MEVWETGRRGSLSLSHLTNNEQQPIEYFKTPSTQQLSTGKTAGGAQGCGSGRLLMDGWMDGWNGNKWERDALGSAYMVDYY